MYPLVSVLIPTYNRADFLKNAIDSVLAQDYPNLEIIVVDDGSTDNTKKIVSAYDSSIVKYFYQENRGVSAARNRCLDLASGAFLGFCDSDDVWLPGKLQAQVEYLTTYLDCQIIFTSYSNSVTNGDLFRSFLTSTEFDKEKNPNTYWLPTALFRRTLPELYGKFKEELICAEDLEWISRLNYSGVDINHKLQEVYYYRLLHGDNILYQVQDAYYKNMPAMYEHSKKLRAFIEEDKQIVRQRYESSGDLISVIIPVLPNEKKQLVYTLQSLKQQTLGSKIEILTISDDNLAVARNRGLQQAQGNFIFFLNAGDILNKESLLFLYHQQEKRPEMVIYGECIAHSWKGLKGNFKIQHSLRGGALLNRKVFDVVGQFMQSDQDMSLWWNKMESILKCCDIDDLQATFLNIQEEYACLRPAKDTVLMIEPLCHLEVLPGYAKYWLDLGYNVDVLILPNQTLEGSNPFCLFPDPRINVIVLPFDKFPEILEVYSSELKKYAGIFFTTGYVESPDYPIRDFFNNLADLNDKLFVVEHHDFPDQALLEKGQVIALAECLPGAKMVNPHYFGDIKIAPKNKWLVRFITTYRHKKLNNDSLISAVQKLHNEGTTNFKITMIGKKLDSVPEELLPYFDFCGPVPYPQLYDKMEQSDFILVMLDPDYVYDQRILDGCGTSGIFQLAYGFKKPVVVKQEFAKLPGFTDENSLIYKQKDDLLSIMRQAIDMEDSQYDKMREALSDLADDIYSQSLENLRSML